MDVRIILKADINFGSELLAFDRVEDRLSTSPIVV